MDFLARRCNVALIDKKASIKMLDKIVEIMKIELNWNEEKVNNEKNEALDLLNNSI